MGKRYTSINDDHRAFIAAQKIFCVATAGRDGRVRAWRHSIAALDAYRICTRL
jgi:predicted pyridoxine 5'-phosphate oxidase superfamily flavin-nucleotide-binding protein